MRYENRQPVEDLYTDDIHPLKEFAWLAIGSLTILTVGVIAIGTFAAELAARVPFSVERDYAAPIARTLEDAHPTPEAQAAQTALRELATALAADMRLPADLTLTIHYSASSQVNALATLGGHIVFYRGLLERLDSEDAVAMVLAHEMAHAHLRHPARGLGRGVAVGILLSTVSSSLSGLAGDQLNKAGMLPVLKFSRDQEADADAMAFAAIARRYGHLGGAQDLFARFSALREGHVQGPEVLQTHPLDAQRVANLKASATQQGWRLDGARRPLPPALQALQKKAAP
jgi:beta-barrel assembly-enhancing protease